VNFDFATAQRIFFGAGKLKQVGALAAEYGKRALVVTGRNPERHAALFEALRIGTLSWTTLAVSGEPTVALAQQGKQLALDEGCDLVISIGGGSAIDAGKAIAALATNPGDVLDYLEVIGRAQPIKHPPLPFMAIPTTAGSGAEATRNAVLASPQHRVKVSLRSPLMLPRVALIDPELTYALPPSVTAATGMDALAQLIEPFVCLRANPMTDMLCREGMTRAARSLRRAYDDGRDGAAREDMALASVFGGMALANAGLGAVHGFAAPIGGMFAAPHGAVCARLLPLVWRANTQALQQREPANPVLERYAEVARTLTGNAQATLQDGQDWLTDLCTALRIPSFVEYGMSADDIDVLVQKAAVASSMQANPIKLTSDELGRILAEAM
jgi:alcohol dehydrogenase class IV